MFMHWSWFSEKKYLCHMDFICDFVGWFNLTCNAVNNPESKDSGTMINSLSAPYGFDLRVRLVVLVEIWLNIVNIVVLM